MKKIKNQNLKAILFLSPAMIILLVFQIYPILQLFLMGFYTKFNYISGEISAIGIENFSYVLGDPNFALAIKNTCILSFFAAPLGIIIALIFAVLLNSDIRLKKVFQTIYFIPFVTSMVAVSIVWSWMLNREFGVVNAVLSVFGIAKVNWLTNPDMTMPILIVLSIWKGLGYKIIILLAGLQSIDQRYYDAARIDGAKSLSRLFNVTIPMLKPPLVFLSITTVISSFKTFDEVYIMYNKEAGPLKSGLTIVYYIFNKFYQEWQFSRAAAASFILFAIILLITLVQFMVSLNKKEAR